MESEKNRFVIDALLQDLNATLLEAKDSLELLSPPLLRPAILAINQGFEENRFISVATQTCDDWNEQLRPIELFNAQLNRDVQRIEEQYQLVRDECRRLKRRIRRMESAALVQSRDLGPQSNDMDNLVQQIHQTIANAALYCRQQVEGLAETAHGVDQSDCSCSCSLQTDQERKKWLLEAWELHSLNTRRRMTLLARHYRKLYGQYRYHHRLVQSGTQSMEHRRIGQVTRLAARLKQDRRRFRVFRRQSHQLERQYQIILQCIDHQIDDVIGQLRIQDSANQHWEPEKTSLKNGLAFYYCQLFIKLQWIRRRCSRDEPIT